MKKQVFIILKRMIPMTQRIWSGYQAWKEKNKDVISKLDDIVTRFKNRIAHESPHTLNWWDGVLFTAFDPHTEKRQRTKILRSYLIEKGLKFLR